VIFNHNKENMNSRVNIPTVPGTPYAGGFFAGHIFVAGAMCALIVAPKAEGERQGAWLKSEARIAGADSYNDGLANTIAMAASGSELAQWARGLCIGGCDDWYLPSQDELEIAYRYFKPTTETNTLYGRSGVNASAIGPTYPYTRELPAQTVAVPFVVGGAEAFEDEAYWSSTQHAANADYAWYQYFDNGYQFSLNKSASLRARAVRRLIIS
jgi:hypothetical protein